LSIPDLEESDRYREKCCVLPCKWCQFFFFIVLSCLCTWK
jgi:hypothetical protein